MMLAYQTMILFMGTTMLLCLIPAPENTLAFTQSIFQGRMSGIAVTLGVCTGLLVHIIGVGAGLAMIVKSSTTIFNILKVVGAAYLAYLAWQVFKIKPATVSTSERVSWPTLYRRGFLVYALNPMVPVFLMIYYPLFIRLEKGATSAQFAQLGVLNILVMLCVFGALSFLGEKAGEKLIRHEKLQLAIRCCTSVVFTITAIILLSQ